MNRLRKGHGQEKAEGDAHCGHDGMHQKGEQEQEHSMPALACQYARDGQQDKSSSYVSRMQMLVGQIQGRA